MNNHQGERTLYKIVNQFSKTLKMFNLSTSDARLFAFLYFNKTPLTLDEMSDALGKSKTSVNTSARNLVDANLANRVWRKGIRKDLYQANPDLFQSLMDASVSRWINFTAEQRDSLEELRKSLQNNEADKSLDTPLQRIIEFHHDIEDSFQKLK